MAFLRSSTKQDKRLLLLGERLYMRLPQQSDFAGWAMLRRESEEFLRPWEPVWTRDELSQTGYRKRIKFYRRGLRDGSAYALFLFSRADHELLGGLTLSNIRYGVIGSCSLGYWIGERYARQGLMTEAIRTILPFVFGTLSLHRLEAACLVDNTASIALLHKCGFREEGRARKYLRINGVWQDHLLFALLEDEYQT